MGIVQFHLIAFLIMHAVALVAPALTLTLILHPTNLQKDGEPLPADRFSLSGGNLTITGLVESDRGMYECSATNEAATITAEAELMIENIAPRAPYNLTANSTETCITIRWQPGEKSWREMHGKWSENKHRGRVFPLKFVAFVFPDGVL